MKGIKMSDCRFYVNEEERTVVCVIPNTRDMVIDYIMENFDFPDFNFYDALLAYRSNRNKFVDALLMPYSFIGKAVCAPEDEWDVELGKMMAFSRAKDKCYKSFFKRANTFAQALDRRLGDMIENFNQFGLKLEHKRDALQAKISEHFDPPFMGKKIKGGT